MVARGIAVLLVAIWFAALALAWPPNHDESQYVAAAVLAGGNRIFRDYASLQPPLHAWAFAPLGAAFPTWVFPAMRLATAASAIAMLALVYVALRRLDVPARTASLTTALLGCCDTVQFTAAVIRNDMLPAVLAAAGIAAAMAGPAGLPALGLGLGLATSTKLSWAPMLALASVHVVGLAGVRRRDRAAFVLGAAVGLLPMAIAAAGSPANFVHGVYTYGATAPFEWYRRIGRPGMLDPIAKVGKTLVAIARGPALPALLIVLPTAGVLARRDPRARLLLWLIAGGAIGALLPTPTHRPYLLPLLPPLFVLLGLALPRLPRQRMIGSALALCAAIGLAGAAIHIGHALGGDWPALRLHETAREAGAILERQRAFGVVATLSPDRVADSGHPLDPRFAAGPFLFRSGGLIAVATAVRLRAATPAALEEMFRAAPPAAILTGYEDGLAPGGGAVDRPIELWAVNHNYDRFTLRDGIGRLYARPAN